MDSGSGGEFECELVSITSTDDESVDAQIVPRINIESITTIETGFTEETTNEKNKEMSTNGSQSPENDCTSQSSSTCDSADFSIVKETKRRCGKTTSKEILQRVSELVEYYLSDDNLINDMFLLKHVTKHKEGYVSLKLLANYKKLKRVRKDWTVLVEALRDSATLQMNEDCTKVKRRKKLPCELEEDTRIFRSVIGYEIAESVAGMEKLAEIFSKFGDIDSIQLHKPGGRSFPEIALAEKELPNIAASLCCLVVFDKVHCARLALKHLINHAELKVMPVPKRKTMPDGKFDASYVPREYESAYFSASDLEDPGSPFSFRAHTPQWNSFSMLPSNNWRNRCLSPSSSTASPGSSRKRISGISFTDERSSSRLGTHFNKTRFPMNQNMSTLPRRVMVARPMQTPPDSPVPFRRLAHHLQTASAPNSPWTRRKVLSRNDMNISCDNNWTVSPRETNAPPNVVRLPRGPDNTRGFHGTVVQRL
ncbi:La-type HTH domain [Trinorchestia longiramus]|nr:La-type HTH domain [Trinorchestia longiramus]